MSASRLGAVDSSFPQPHFKAFLRQDVMIVYGFLISLTMPAKIAAIAKSIQGTNSPVPSESLEPPIDSATVIKAAGIDNIPMATINQVRNPKILPARFIRDVSIRSVRSIFVGGFGSSLSRV
jgi:hypothetical protein